MSTENTQTDATSSDASVESTSVTTGSTESTGSGSQINSVDGLKSLSKEMDAKEASFVPKTVDQAVAEAQKPAAPVVPAYNPNYKYKAALQEKEVDEFWRGLIKDADSEKKVKDALTKLDGFDAVKASREKLQSEYESVVSDYTNQSQIINRVEQSLQRGDLSSVFRQLGLNDESIFKYTQQKLQMMEMPEDQRKIFDEAEQLRAHKYQMEEQMAQYQQMYETQAVQARTMQLDSILLRPEVNTSANNWDQMMGQQGAFRDLVIQEAQNAYHQSGQDLSAEQAVQRVMYRFGRVMSGQQQTAQEVAPQMQQPMQQKAQVMQQHSKPVIPNISGKGAAPIKKVPKSLDDLKRMAKELQE